MGVRDILKHIVVVLLTFEAKLVLRKYKPRIIAVTGSVGKTSTKDAVYSVLSSSFHVRKSEKSFNSEIGIPLTILGMPNAWSNIFQWIKNLIEGASLILLRADYPRILVLEVGADRPGDIRDVSKWLGPDAVILTRFPDVPVHVEFFDSSEHVITEKMYLVRALRKTGTLILNADDEAMSDIAPPREGSLLRYGMSEGADVQCQKLAYIYKEGFVCGMGFDVLYNESKTHVELRGSLGVQHVYPVLAALALGISEGLNLEEMCVQLKDHTPPPGRMRLISGINNSIIIDDTYNSSPIAVEEALNTLINIQTKGRRIAVLGDMLELGNHSIPAHKKVGQCVAERADMFVSVGIRSRYSVEEAERRKMKKKNILIYNDSNEAAEALPQHIQEGDVVLVKGSQSIRMERVVRALMQEPLRAEDLLVRHDTVWLKR